MSEPVGVGAGGGQRRGDELGEALQRSGLECLGEGGDRLVTSLEQLTVGAKPCCGQAQVDGPSAAGATLDPPPACETIDEPHRAGVGQVQCSSQLVDAHVRVGGDRDERRWCRSGNPGNRLG